MANNSSDVLNTQGALGSPRHISGDKSTRPSSQQRLRQNAPRAYNLVESMRNARRETAIVRFLFPRSATPASVRRVALGGDCAHEPGLQWLAGMEVHGFPVREGLPTTQCSLRAKF